MGRIICIYSFWEHSLGHGRPQVDVAYVSSVRLHLRNGHMHRDTRRFIGKQGFPTLDGVVRSPQTPRSIDTAVDDTLYSRAITFLRFRAAIECQKQKRLMAKKNKNKFWRLLAVEVLVLVETATEEAKRSEIELRAKEIETRDGSRYDSNGVFAKRENVVDSQTN